MAWLTHLAVEVLESGRPATRRERFETLTGSILLQAVAMPVPHPGETIALVVVERAGR